MAERDLFLNAAGAVIQAIAGDDYSAVSLQYSPGLNQHFTVYLHANGACSHGMGDTPVEALADARARA